MKIKYNEFGEVISVNGLATGQHIGMPLQDALGTPEENLPYYEERSTVTNCYNTCDDAQPVPVGANIQPLEITENGTYNVEDGVNGYAPVVVNVATGGVSSWNDLADKPFYEESTLEEKIPEQTIEIAMNEELGLPIAFIASAYEFAEGDTVYVKFDGVEYICKTVGGVLGNGSLAGEGENTGEPFVYSYNEDMGGFLLSLEEGTHTFSAALYSTIVHPLEEKYLPPIQGTLPMIEIKYDESDADSEGFAPVNGRAQTALDAVPRYTPIIVRLSEFNEALIFSGILNSVQSISDGSTPSFYGVLYAGGGSSYRDHVSVVRRDGVWKVLREGVSYA